jgi:hypothetical protein
MKTFVVWVLIFLSSAQAAEWSYMKEIRLKKDQLQTVLVKEEPETTRVLKFRWTLYAGDGLVMHLNFNDLATQFILYTHYKKDAYKLQLLPKRSVYERAPYMYLIFKKFDYKTKEAYFDIVVDDAEKRTLIEVKPLKESR